MYLFKGGELLRTITPNNFPFPTTLQTSEGKPALALTAVESDSPRDSLSKTGLKIPHNQRRLRRPRAAEAPSDNGAGEAPWGAGGCGGVGGGGVAWRGLCSAKISTY